MYYTIKYHEGKLTEEQYEEYKKLRQEHYALARSAGYTRTQANRIKDWRTNKVLAVCYNLPIIL